MQELTFLQFHAGMLKVVVYLLCIYSSIGNELLRAIIPTFLQFHAGMLKDVYLLCIYSGIGSELLRAIVPFTLLDL